MGKTNAHVIFCFCQWEIYRLGFPNELPSLHPSVPRNQDDDRTMAASNSSTSPFTTQELSGRLAELLVRAKQTCSSTIATSNRPANRATLYLQFNPQSELVREIENGFNKVRSEFYRNFTVHRLTYYLEVASLLSCHFLSGRIYSRRDV